MVRCDCLDPERHGHMDDCPFSEIDALKARLAEAERLLREADEQVGLQDAYVDYSVKDRIGNFLLATDSAADRDGAAND